MKKVFHYPDIQQINVLDERFYTEKDTGVFYPSSTEVLNVYPKGIGFTNWLKENGKDADKIKEFYGDRGSKVHNAVDRINAGVRVNWLNPFTGEYDYTVDEWKMISHYFDFYTRFKPELLTVINHEGEEQKASELRLISHTHKLGGTLDMGMMLKGRRGVVDVKCTGDVYSTHELQVASYAMMWNDTYPDQPIDFTGILWLNAKTRTEGKKGAIQGAGWQLVTYDRHYTKAFKLFEACRLIWDEENPNPKPKNLIYPDSFCIDDVHMKNDVMDAILNF
jgi:hypothetical protein